MQISIQNLTFAYEGSYDNIFEDVSFVIDTDWKLGFVGRNGRGKTTFLRLLLGGLEYSGVISAGVEFLYFPFAVADGGRLAGDVVAEVAPEYEDWRLRVELGLLEVDEEVLGRPFDTLSNGEQTKLLLAALFLGDGRFLLIDEPTNHLDAHGRAVVSRYLRGKAGFILVSHDRAFLDGCVDHVLSINRANIEVQRGNFSQWYANKQRQDNFELAANEKLQKEISRLKRAARQSGGWADKVEATKIGKGSGKVEKSMDSRAYIGEKSRRMQQRRKNLERRQEKNIEEKSALLKNLDHASALKVAQLAYHKQLYLSLNDVSISYGGKLACENVSFDVNRGDRVLLHGRNGSGKSSLLKLILSGERPLDAQAGQQGMSSVPASSVARQISPMSHSGELAIGSGLKISYVSQDTSHLSGNLTDYARLHDIDESLFKAILRKLDFSRLQLEKDMQNFSGGQKKKTLIAKSLCQQAHLLIWDEPLNFIDVLSRMQIESLLLEYQPTIVFVEHDKLFCEKIATKTVNLSPS